MKAKQRNKEFELFTKKQHALMQKKSGDYANEDVLNNFKVAGKICGLSSQQQCLSLIATKVARLGVLLESGKPNFESIDDSIIDLANYTFILHCLNKDK